MAKFTILLVSEVRTLEAMEGKDEEDERREAAISSTPSLQPDFTPIGGVTYDQLSKFQELHKKRLQIKARSKMKKKTKDGSGKLQTKDFTKDYDNKVEASKVSTPFSHNDKNATFLKQESAGTSLSLKRRQKLHWGLDTKERWERKANM